MSTTDAMGTSPSVHHRPDLRRRYGWLLVAYLVPVAALVFSTRLGDQGIPPVADALLRWSQEAFGDTAWWAWLGGLRYGHLEAAANVLLFIPLGLLLAGLLGRRAHSAPGRRRGIPAVAVWLLTCSLSVVVESTQLYLLAERSGTLRDLACNSLGALIGVLVFQALHRLRPHRRRTPEPTPRTAPTTPRTTP